MHFAGRKKFEGSGKKPQAEAKPEAIKEPLRYYYHEIRNFPIPKPEETNALARIYAEHKQFPNSPIAENARKLLVEGHLRLAHSIAHKYYGILRDTNFRTTTADLVQAANLGLLKAVEKHDPKKGNFTNFAGYCMRAFALDEIAKSRIVRIPPRYLVRKLEAELLQIESMERRGAELNRQQLSALMKRKDRIGERINAVERAMNLIDLDAPLKDSEDSYLDTVVGLDGMIREKAELSQVRQAFRKALEKSRTLTPIEKRVIEMRIVNAQSISNPPIFEEIGKNLGVSRQGAKQVFDSALARLQAFPELRQAIKAVRIIHYQSKKTSFRIKAPNKIQKQVIIQALNNPKTTMIERNILQAILSGKQPTIKELSSKLKIGGSGIRGIIINLRRKIQDPVFESLFK